MICQLGSNYTLANLLLKPQVIKECIINTYLYNRMLSFLTVTSTRHPPAHPAGEVAPRRAAMSDRRPETIARRWICAGLSGGRRLSPAPRPFRGGCAQANRERRPLLRRLANQAGPRSNLDDLFKGGGSSRRPIAPGRPPAATLADWGLEFGIFCRSY